jgi:D-arabinose 1-dehydrogenase-like Zn-dependent alcohol dehydrogenase
MTNLLIEPSTAVGPNDVKLKIAYCGICHSDLHLIKNEWGNSQFPMVPGHEIVGTVTELGSSVSDLKIGDKVAIGCLTNSCRECRQCKADSEQYCPGMEFTYNGKEKGTGQPTQGGYSSHIVADRHFVLRFPDNLAMDAGAPLLCAGITVYSPMKYYGLDKPGQRIGVVGLGGLGHMAVKFAKAFGQEVVVISTSPAKKEEACGRLGADKFLVSKNAEEMAAAAATLDGIIDTVSGPHELMPYLSLLGVSGKYVCLGAPTEPYQVSAFPLLFSRISVGGSLIGGIKETQEMLDFCSQKNIVCDIERIPVSYVNEAMERLVKSDVRYRFVLDIEGTLEESAAAAASK